MFGSSIGYFQSRFKSVHVSSAFPMQKVRVVDTVLKARIGFCKYAQFKRIKVKTCIQKRNAKL